jgi:hypothetical protein
MTIGFFDGRSIDTPEPVSLTGLGALSEVTFSAGGICYIENGKRPPDSHRRLFRLI